VKGLGLAEYTLYHRLPLSQQSLAIWRLNTLFCLLEVIIHEFGDHATMQTSCGAFGANPTSVTGLFVGNIRFPVHCPLMSLEMQLLPFRTDIAIPSFVIFEIFRPEKTWTILAPTRRYHRLNSLIRQISVCLRCPVMTVTHKLTRSST
jgi:hypothetical protein